MIGNGTDIDSINLLSSQNRAIIPSTNTVEHLENGISALSTVQAVPFPMKIGECTVTLRFASEHDPSIRREVAELMLAAVQQGG